MSPYKDPEKQKEYHRQYYKEHRDYYLKNADKARKKKKNFVRNIKKRGKCNICGEDRWYCLAFHHKDANTKKDTVANLLVIGVSYEVLKNEIDKCILLCHNCHAEVEHG